jgi:alcohol dehydrogenase
MSAYHPELPHGAGLIMVSLAYYSHFAAANVCEERLVTMAKALGKMDAKCGKCFVTALADLQKRCGVDGLKMSDYGIRKDEIHTLAANARHAMGGLFDVDPAPLSQGGVVSILEESYR